jgi:hypothetical protein
MRGITGKPDLAHAKDSWRKTQDTHDEILKKPETSREEGRGENGKRDQDERNTGAS